MAPTKRARHTKSAPELLAEIGQRTAQLNKDNLENIVEISSLIGTCAHFRHKVPKEVELWFEDLRQFDLYVALELARKGYEKEDAPFAAATIQYYLRHKAIPGKV